jgi:hypothetical protein
MYTNNPNLVYDLAQIRLAELREVAARNRLVRDARAAQLRTNRVAELRRLVGAVLVTAGERLQGAQRPTAAGARPTDVTAITGHLRVVR